MKKIIIISIISILLIANLFLGTSYYLLQADVGRFSDISQNNRKIVALSTLFIQKVLKTQGAVSFEDRLRLENAAYSTNDLEIIGVWQSFLASETEQEAQARVLDLLSILSVKIAY